MFGIFLSCIVFIRTPLEISPSSEAQLWINIFAAQVETFCAISTLSLWLLSALVFDSTEYRSCVEAFAIGLLPMHG